MEGDGVSDPWKRKEVIGDATLYLGDCLAVLPTLSRIGMIATDPPYSSGGAFRGDRARDTRDKYVSSDSRNQDVLADFSGDTRDQRGFHFWCALWSGLARLSCEPGAVACFFTDWRQLPVSTDYLQAGGWVWRGIVPWAKKTARPQKGRFAASCEYVVWGSNGAMPFERGVGCLPGFFDFSYPAEREHVAQKPDGLMEEIVAICAPGGTVLDLFMGSGTTGVACAAAALPFVGIEIDEESFETSCRRIEDAQRQQRMFA